MNISSPNNISFKARCPQIRDADWICRKVNSTFPCVSTTRLQKILINHYNRTFPPPEEFLKPVKTMKELINSLDWLTLTKEDIKNCSLKKRIIRKLGTIFLVSREERKNLRLLASIKERIDNFGYLRVDNYYSEPKKRSYTLLKKYKTGNCEELSIMTALALKLNGINNVEVRILENLSKFKSLDHCVCVFNLDGTRVGTKIKNNTVIVDTWAGKADFAKNMFTYYKNMLKNELEIADDTKLGLGRLISSTETKYIEPYEPKSFGMSEAESLQLIRPKRRHLS